MGPNFLGPIEELTLALCGKPARDHWRPTPEGFERASCQECAAIGRVLSANRRQQQPAVPAPIPAAAPAAGQPIRLPQPARR